ncbi:MAG TPA: hypothetical protein VHC43_05820 [Mycobacteriales bacterium]|nr:hypothetical protein [Mycobacteriales bacterium]
MTTETVQSAPKATATMPRVNLMPPEIAEAAKFRQVQAALGGAIVVALALAFFLYHHEHAGVAAAKDQLSQAQEQQTILQGQLTSLASVKATFADVQAKQAELSSAMGDEVRWSFFLNDLTFALPSNVWMSSLEVTDTGPQAAAPTTTGTLGSSTAAAPAPTVVPIGSVSMSLTGFVHDDVAAWLDAMAKNKYFLTPTFGGSTEGQIGSHPIVTFAGTLALSSAALSHRFDAPAATPGTTAP